MQKDVPWIHSTTNKCMSGNSDGWGWKRFGIIDLKNWASSLEKNKDSGVGGSKTRRHFSLILKLTYSNTHTKSHNKYLPWARSIKLEPGGNTGKATCDFATINKQRLINKDWDKIVHPSLTFSPFFTTAWRTYTNYHDVKIINTGSSLVSFNKPHVLYLASWHIYFSILNRNLIIFDKRWFYIWMTPRSSATCVGKWNYRWKRYLKITVWKKD